MIRFLAILLSVYVLALTALPCDDVPEHLHRSGPLTEQSSHEHNGGDLCSPFCTCNCCATPMVCYVAQPIQNITTVVLKHETHYSLPRIQNLPTEIWTPPQLS